MFLSEQVFFSKTIFHTSWLVNTELTANIVFITNKYLPNNLIESNTILNEFSVHQIPGYWQQRLYHLSLWWIIYEWMRSIICVYGSHAQESSGLAIDTNTYTADFWLIYSLHLLQCCLECFSHSNIIQTALKICWCILSCLWLPLNNTLLVLHFYYTRFYLNYYSVLPIPTSFCSHAIEFRASRPIYNVYFTEMFILLDRCIINLLPFCGSRLAD